MGRSHCQKEPREGARGNKRKAEAEKCANLGRTIQIDKLWQKRQKEQRDFGIENVGQNAPAKGQSRRHGSSVLQWRNGIGSCGKSANSEVDKVCRACQFYCDECGCRGRKNGRQTECCGECMHDTASADSQSGCETYAATVRDAGAENVKRILPWRKIQNHACCDE